MFEIGEVSAKFVTHAFLFLAILLAWNFIGRRLADTDAKDIEIPAWLSRAAGFIHVGVIAGLILWLLLFLVGGTIDNPTDFRYATF